ncbi:sugar phosphate isomerase/epimerase family protein [Aegicerativicinus sediminis]|uniref:sugar phosphate isomerase/epimerase family protein n=1 Tax=Aegicerativicinus sediminis TaxID=2893202 RepID=UPI001E3776B3|nr:sugar phosphate isomerase/epimerase family protein [Aegicerativicinus sediminis]
MNSHFSHKIIALLLVGALTVFSCKNSEKETTTDETVQSDSLVDTAPFFKLSLAQWSLHRAMGPDGNLSPFEFAEKAKEYGFTGIEYVSQLYRNQIEEIGLEAVLDTLKQKSSDHGIENVLIMIDGEGDLASPKEEERNEAVENHKKWVDAAAFLGCHSIRVNVFGSNDPEEWSKAAEDGLRKLAEYAGTKNINVIVENHGWLSSDPPKMLAVLKAVRRDNVGTLPDFGNFCIKRGNGERWGECVEEYPDIYKGIEMLMAMAKGVSAKSYDFNKEGYETKLDYPRLLKIVKDAGYTGYIDVEYEGNRLSEEEGILATKTLLLKSAESLN